MEHYGSAYIDVNADSRNFERQLKKKIDDAVKDVKIVLNPELDDKGLQGQVNRLARELSGAEVKFKASLDTDRLTRSVDSAKKKLDSLSDKTINVNARVTNTSTNQIQKDIKKAVSESSPGITIKVDGNLKPLRDKLTKFREAQSDKKLELELDLSDKVADSRMESFLNRWDSETFGVNVDLEGVEEAYDHLEHLQSKFEDLHTEVSASSSATAEASASSITSQISQLLSGGGGGGGGGGTGPFVVPITPKLSFNPFSAALKDRQTKDAIKGFTTALAGVVPMDQIKDSFLNIMADLEGTALRFATQITKASAAAAGIVGAIGGAVRLVSDIGQALQVVAAAPAILAAGVAGMQAMKIAWSGFGGALDMDPEKAAEALAELTPKARASAVEMRKLKVAIVEATQEAYWDAMGDSIVKASKALQGPMVKGMEGTATSMAEMTVAMTDQITAFAKSGGLATTFSNINTAISNASGGVGSFTEALLTLTRVGSERLPRLGEWITELGNAFNDFISRSEDSGAILGWIDNGVRRFQQLGSIVGSVASIFDEINQSARAAGYLGLTAVTDALELAANAMNHPNFRSGLFTMLDSARIAWQGFGTGVGHMLAGLATQVDNLGQMMISSGEVGEMLGRNLESMFAKSSLFDGLSDMMANVVQGMDYLEPGFISLGNAMGDFAIIAGTIFREMAPGINTVARMMEDVIGNMVPAFETLTPVLNDAVHIITRMLIPIVDGASGAFSNFLQALANVPTPVMAAGIAIGHLAGSMAILSRIPGAPKWLTLMPGLFTGIATSAATAVRAVGPALTSSLSAAMSGAALAGSRVMGSGMVLGANASAGRTARAFNNTFAKQLNFKSAISKASTALTGLGTALAGLGSALLPVALIAGVTSVFMMIQEESQRSKQSIQNLADSFDILEGRFTDINQMKLTINETLQIEKLGIQATLTEIGSLFHPKKLLGSGGAGSSSFWDIREIFSGGPDGAIAGLKLMAGVAEDELGVVRDTMKKTGVSAEDMHRIFVGDGGVAAGRTANHIGKAWEKSGKDQSAFIQKYAKEFESFGYSVDELNNLSLSEFDGLVTNFIGHSGSVLESARPKVDDFKQALQGLASASLPDDFWEALSLNPSPHMMAALTELDPKINTLTSNYKTLGDETSSLDQKLGALRSNMEVLGLKTLGNVKGAYDYQMGLTQLKEEFDGLGKAIEKANNDGANLTSTFIDSNGALNVTTEAGQRMYEVLSKQAELIEGNYMSTYQQVLQETGSQQKAMNAALDVAKENIASLSTTLTGLGVPPEVVEELLTLAGLDLESIELAIDVLNYEGTIQKLIATEAMAAAISSGDYSIALKALDQDFYDKLSRAIGATNEFTAEDVIKYLEFNTNPEEASRLMAEVFAIVDPTIPYEKRMEMIDNASPLLQDFIDEFNLADGAVAESSVKLGGVAEAGARLGEINEKVLNLPDAEMRATLDSTEVTMEIGTINSQTGALEEPKNININTDNLQGLVGEFDTIQGYTFTGKQLDMVTEDNITNVIAAIQAMSLNPKYQDLNVEDYVTPILDSIEARQLSPELLEILGDDTHARNTMEALVSNPNLTADMIIGAVDDTGPTLDTIKQRAAEATGPVAIDVDAVDNASPKFWNIQDRVYSLTAPVTAEVNLQDNASGGAVVIGTAMAGIPSWIATDITANDEASTAAQNAKSGLESLPATTNTTMQVDMGQVEHMRGVLRSYKDTTINVTTNVSMGNVEHMRGVLRSYQNTTINVTTNVSMGNVEHLRGVLRSYQNTTVTVTTVTNMGNVEHLRGVLRNYQNTTVTVNTVTNMGNVEHLRGVLRHYENTTVTVNTVVNSSAVNALQARIAAMRSRTLTITVTARDSASAVVNRLRGIRIPNKAVVLTARDTATAVVNRIRGARLPNKTVVVTARDSASASLNRIRGIQIPAKTVRVIVNDSASAGLNRVRALQIPVKTARVMINDRATAVLNKVRAFKLPIKTFSVVARDYASSVIRRINAMRVYDKSNTITTYHRNVQRNAIGGINNARGVRAFANGGFENHVAQIARGGWPYRVWAEPETGGEAYIPLAKSKRHRSEQILMQVAKMFGMTLSRSTSGIAKSISSAQGSVQKFANGGFSGVKSMSFATGGIIRENRVLTNRVTSLKRQSKSLQTRINNANKLVKTYEARQKAFQKAKNTRMANRYKARAAAQKKSADRLKKQQDAINKRRDKEQQKLNELRNAQKSWDNSKNNSIRYFRDIGEGVSSGLDAMRKSIRSEYRGFLDMARDAPDATRRAAATRAARTVNAQSRLTRNVWRNGEIAGLRHTNYRISNPQRNGNIALTLADVSKAFEKTNEIFQNASRAMQQIADKLSSEFSFASSMEMIKEQNLPSGGKAMLGSAKQTRKNLTEFNGLLKQLQTRGFGGLIIGEIASMGSTDGMQAARELLKLGKADMNALNKAYNDIQKQSEKIGSWVGANMYNTGAEIIGGTVKGIENNLKKLENAAMKIAKTVEATVKKQLKIKSPSRVFRDEVGAMIGAGLVEGMDNSEMAVADASNRLARAAYTDPMVESSGSRSGLGASNGGGNHTAYNVNYNVYNPVAEKASDAAKKTRTTLKHLGDI